MRSCHDGDAPGTGSEPDSEHGLPRTRAADAVHGKRVDAAQVRSQLVDIAKCDAVTGYGERRKSLQKFVGIAGHVSSCSVKGQSHLVGIVLLTEGHIFTHDFETQAPV